ncbi:MAG: glycosyl transferase [Bacteriovoracaceae bacterium]|nr:glycosyl transferase [Bacteriovoracaceae bacterium]
MAYRNVKILSGEDEVFESSFPSVVATPFPTKTGALNSLWSIVLDRVFAALIVLLLAPVFILVSLAILILSGRPIFYSQKRIGKDGSEFRIFKFRTMVNGAHSLKSQLQHMNFMTGPFFKIKNDPRITREGKFLRKWSLDELPQLFNVLAGDMSLVGPRPMLPEEIRELNCEDILSVPPGLTGLWQVSGRNEVVDFKQKLALDRIYVQKKNFFFDLLILMKTFKAVVASRGAY